LTYGKSYEDRIEEEDQRWKDIPAQEYDLIRNLLLYQLPRNHFSDKQWKLMEFMVECVDDSGFFKIPLCEVAEKTGMSTDEVEHALKILQELEPYGIFAPDLKQCLLKQLEMTGQKETIV
jgi:RNA polymerase sigma-54 factor